MDLNQKYFDLLFQKKDLPSEKLILKDKGNDSNVIPYSITSESEKKEFDIYRYEDLSIDEEILKEVSLKILKMQAGLGSSVKRDDLVEKLSAKGVDLKFEYKDEMLPIAKIHFEVFNELKKRNIYKKIIFQNLVNNETKADIEILSKDYDVKASIEQLKMPTIDENGNITYERLAPLGHGFIGLYEIVDCFNSDEIVAIGNGEDLNSTVDEKILSLVQTKNIPILMITTTKTKEDKKGGQLALVKEKKSYLTIVEKAQAQNNDQLEYFEELGLRTNDKEGLFNTNIVVINKKALREVIHSSIKDFNLDEFLKNISPDVIQNIKEQDGKEFIQLESALGSVVLNTDKYFRQAHNKKVLSILNLSKSDREKFFLPIKKREDYDDLLSHYKFDFESLKLKKN